MFMALLFHSFHPQPTVYTRCTLQSTVGLSMQILLFDKAALKGSSVCLPLVENMVIFPPTHPSLNAALPFSDNAS